MRSKSNGLDPLFLLAERQAADYARFPQQAVSDKTAFRGVLSSEAIERRVRDLQRLDVDSYVAAAVLPSEDPNRFGARWVIRRLGGQVLNDVDMGPLYAAEMVLDFGEGVQRRVGILAQERKRNSGVWMPEHHLRAVEIIREYASRAIPIVTFMDTPGADAGETANRHNQAHCISLLIAEMAQMPVPTVGIILGNGYSGGAIPLATTNILLCVRDGVFNTIQPRGLAGIARKYDLSWQECAKYVGVSSYELCHAGLLDGVIDFVPGEEAKIPNLIAAIGSAIQTVEWSAERYVSATPEVFEHYRRSVFRYLDPSQPLRKLQHSALSLLNNPTEQPNIFGVTLRHLRYLGLRRRIQSTTQEQYGRLSAADVPRGELRRRTAAESRRIFQNWLQAPLEIRYDDELAGAWKQYIRRRRELSAERGAIGRMFLGDQDTNFHGAVGHLLLMVGFHLMNQWKGAAQGNFMALAEYLGRMEASDEGDPNNFTVLDVMRRRELVNPFIEECENFLLFDMVYDNLINGMRMIAREVKDTNAISLESVKTLFEASLQRASDELSKRRAKGNAGAAGDDRREEVNRRFMAWIGTLARHERRDLLLKKMEEWKKFVYPRVSEPLFAIITFYFAHLLPAYFATLTPGRTKPVFDGRIRPKNIGVRDFWNRLTLAYQDILIHTELERLKKSSVVTTRALIERFFTQFVEMDSRLMTADPFRFPGFRGSIEEAIAKGIPPCGAITGIARLKSGGTGRHVGVVLSNLEFQAGAFDMAACEKFCKLLVECARRELPIIAFISSGGMQTKEGAGALFPMAILNDRITRFVRETGQPVLCFGFGDCTGGAQASFVTHPLVQTYYFSGSNMPFAGQIVVTEHLPYIATLSNYLSREPGAMQGMVKHPFHENLDEVLRAIDPKVPVARETVQEVIDRVLRLELDVTEAALPSESQPTGSMIVGPYTRVLVHARGCAAEKIVRKAQEGGYGVVLVQSDADMESPAAAHLRRGRDQLVCIGGNTPAESYLNALSIVRVAERTGSQALHPGIGFLSESAAFARLCRGHGINFIGPPAESMDLMGHKSNAIHTAANLKIPTVPGSNGIVTHPEAAAGVAEQIGYPVIIKAVHGGGGKGIAVVDKTEDFTETFQRISAEARGAFGNGDVYLERFIKSLRHVEVQILRDVLGHTKVLGLRDCSVQRNNQKVIEESGSTMLPPDLEKSILGYAAKIADSINYVGAGTVEFIFDLLRNEVYFMEMNTRLQVEHPVTEAVTGIDIVLAQFRIAAGDSIESMQPGANGYSMELRINAEKPTTGADGKLSFVPCPGEVTTFRFPETPGISLIRAVDEGKMVTPYYDGMIVQLIAHAPDRNQTISMLRKYLDTVEIRGICTNIPLLKRILDDEIFNKGIYDTTYLKEFTARLDTVSLTLEMEEAAGLSAKSLDMDALRITGTNELRLPAPSAGVFYRTPSPGEPEFVRPGDVIDVYRTLCLMEAMKTFSTLSLATFRANDTPLFAPGKFFEIVRVVPENGQAVNRDDLLFVIRPAANGAVPHANKREE